MCAWVFFFNDTATTEIYTLSLHDALPISLRELETARAVNPRDERTLARVAACLHLARKQDELAALVQEVDRKSTRLNSSHANISYAVFCLKKRPGNHHQPGRLLLPVQHVL